jgi:hypothetical protein
MYAVDPVLPVETLSPGTTMIVTGTEEGECRALADRLLAIGLERDEPAVAVATGDPPAAVRDRIPDAHESPVATVSMGVSEESSEDLTRCIESTNDFSAVGLACSELVERLADDRVRVSVDTVSDLLGVADTNTVFRFMHVLTGRITAADGLGIATLQVDRHDQQTCSTISQLFDARVKLRRRSGKRELRVRGVDGVPEKWTEF